MNILNHFQTMQVYFIKEVQAFEYVTFTELKIDKQSDFCCEKLKKYVAMVKSWSSKIGKFCIVEKDILVEIDYCPFCGEKIEYISVE
ncbi:hypothetical protein DSQ20_04670 [Nitrosarchaeum sp. AC2]|nr:hypothetical protein DSQ20_04670 [Nitrosarchaeum sp. AC2]